MKGLLRVENITLKRSDSFNLSVEKLVLKKGRILCIAGPNGSGKTTLIEILGGILNPDNGVIKFQGRELHSSLIHNKLNIGFIPDIEDWFIKELTANEYFQLLADTYRDAGVKIDIQKRIKELSKKLNFTAIHQPLASLSHGNKKKAQIIAGLMHQPKIIIIDEIRNGLDPLAIIVVERLIRSEAKRGAIIIAATHDLWWAERVSDETILLWDGKLLLHSSTKDLIKEHGSLENLFIERAGIGYAV